MKRLAFILMMFVATTGFAKVPEAYVLFNQGEYQKAYPDIKKMAKSGNKVALYYLGLMTMQGYVVPKNESKGVGLIKQAASRGYVKAQRFMGNYYLKHKKQPTAAFTWYKKAADRGDNISTLYVAGSYLHGYGVKQNRDKARRYITKAAQNGNALAQYELSEMFRASKHRRSKRLGIAWLKKAAKGGNQKAQVELANVYADGRELGRNPYKAQEWFNKAVNQETKDTYYLKGHYLAHSDDLSDKARALPILEQAAKAGHADAQYELGVLYLSPEVDVTDDKKAVKLLEASAGQDNAKAKAKLVVLYQEGLRTEKNEKRQAHWKSRLNTVSEQNRQARLLSWLQRDNEVYAVFSNQPLPGVLNQWAKQSKIADGALNNSPKMVLLKKETIFSDKLTLANPSELSMIEVFDYLGPISKVSDEPIKQLPEYPVKFKHVNAEDVRKIYGQARVGNRVAQFQMGQFHQHGIVVAKNDKLAYAWYKQSAELNFVKAEYNLALMSLYGQGVDVSYRKGLFWLNRAAFKGNHFAQYALGRIYQKGFGNFESNHYIAKDSERAISLFYMAASGGNEQAKFALANLLDAEKNTKKLTQNERTKQHEFITRLYEESAKSGVEGAKVPLAFYLATSNSKQERLEWAVGALEKVASNGDSNAELIIGMMYDRGLGVNKDTGTAVSWYKSALDNNNVVAKYILGTYYYLGEEVSRNKSYGTSLLVEARNSNLPFAYYNLAAVYALEDKPYLDLMVQAADLGSHRASLFLADRALTDTASNSTLANAVKVYQHYSALGYAKPALKLGYLYDNGIYFSKNAQQAETYYRKAANADDKYAQFLLGNLYQFAKLGHSDIAKANFWYKKAAKQELIPAYIALGVTNEVYANNYPQAKAWFDKAAFDGSKVAAYNLALIHDYGKGHDINESEGLRQYQVAAGHGITPAKFTLANKYLTGDGVSQDTTKAFHWYNQLANENTPDVNYQLGMMHESGVGTDVNIHKAINAYLKAQNKTKSLLALARFYQYGLGVPKDDERALRFYELAAKKGSRYAKLQMARIYLSQANVPDAVESTDIKRLKQGKDAIKSLAKSGYMPAKVLAHKWAITVDKKKKKEDKTLALDKPKPTVSSVPVTDRDSANLMYIDAIADLNDGKEFQSKAVLKRLIYKFPRFEPAKQMLNEMSTSDRNIEAELKAPPKTLSTNREAETQAS